MNKTAKSLFDYFMLGWGSETPVSVSEQMHPPNAHQSVLTVGELPEGYILAGPERRFRVTITLLPEGS